MPYCLMEHHSHDPLSSAEGFVALHHGDAGGVIGVDRFGASAPGETVVEYGFTVDNVCLAATALLS